MKKIQLALLALVVMSLSNCKKDVITGPAGPQGPSGPETTGNLKGYVTLLDQYGGKILTNLSGDTVSIDGTPTKAITDNAGLYTLPGISTGVYTLTIVKPGYGTTKIQNIQFVGGADTYRDAKISEPSTSILPALIDSVGATTGNITIYATIPANVQGRTFILYVSDNASVSSATNSYLIFYTKVVNANATKLSFTIPKSDLTDAGFISGSTAYFAAYGIGSTLTASAYEDFTNGRTAFTAVSSTAATLNLMVP